MKELNYNITSLFDILGLVQGVFLGIILISENRKLKPRLFLGFFLITYTIELISSILEDLSIIEFHPNLLLLPFNFLFITLPLFYIYIKYITGDKITNKKMSVLLLPGIIEFLFFLILFLFPANEKIKLVNSNNFEIFEFFYYLLSFWFNFYYIIKSIRYITKNKIQIENLYSNTKGKTLFWAKSVLIFMLVFHLLWFIEIFQSDYNFETYTYPILSFINIIFIFWIGISGLKQVFVFESTYGNKIEINNSNLKPNQDKFTVINYELYTILVDNMNDKQWYEKPNLSLIQVANLMNVTPKKLSQIIKINTKQNFNHFVNFYRVEKAKKLLKDVTFNNFNMLGIAIESGFNSKATFYSVFKKITGMTPKTFKIEG